MRSEYWWPYLMHVGVTTVLVTAAYLAGMDMDLDAEEVSVSSTAAIFLTLLMLYMLAVFVPSVAVLVRRLHDIDKSGWLAPAIMVTGLIPAIGILAPIAQTLVGCLPGTPGANRYGEQPGATVSREL